MKAPRPRVRAERLIDSQEFELAVEGWLEDNSDLRQELVRFLARYGEACARARLRTASKAIRRELGFWSPFGGGRDGLKKGIEIVDKIARGRRR